MRPQHTRRHKGRGSAIMDTWFAFLWIFKRKLKGKRLLFLSDGRVDGPCSLYSRFNNERGLTVWINHRRRNDRPASIGRVCRD